MSVEAHFEDHKSVIFDELSHATKSVSIAVAWINFKEYFDIFDMLLNRNIKLKIICSDNPQNRAHKLIIEKLKLKKAEIKLLKMPATKNHMHHKFAVVDEKVLINGSFNWSPNAEKSLENLIVIKDAPSEVRKFLDEFDKILSIESATIKALHKKTKCKNCGGEILNVLIFSERASMHYETSGDIVSLCNSCYEFNTLKHAISNNQLYILADSLGGADEDYEYEYIDRMIKDELNSYINDKITLHGIGKVNSGLDFEGEDYTNTDIIWKNKFVGDRLPDIIYDQDFDVLYDN